MPNGIVPVLTGAVAATGFYFGAEIVTIAAAESAEPERAVAATTQSVIWRVLIFYIGSIFLVVAIVPWNDTVRMARPYVSVMEALQDSGGGDSNESGHTDRRAVGAELRPVRLLAHADGARLTRRCADGARTARCARRAGGRDSRQHRLRLRRRWR